MKKETTLAVDLGGTKLLIGEVDRDGTILGSRKYPSGYMDQKQASERILECIRDYIHETGFVGVQPETMGIGMIGQVDVKNGIWKMIDHRRNTPMPLAEIMEDALGMKCFLENDVKAAARAEKAFGGGKEMDDFIYLNVGTGIAAGIYSGGHLIRGWQNDAGEIGHMTVDYRGNADCFCGRKGCVEAIASGIGLDRRVKALAGQYPESVLQEHVTDTFVRAEWIFRAAEEGDSLALRVAEDAVDALMQLILNLIKTFNPEKIILGGGVAGSTYMQKKLMPRLKYAGTESVAKGVVLSELNPDTVGLIGAAAAGFDI